MTAHVPEEQISAWLDRQLGDAESRLVEEHLRGCRACSAAREELSGITGLFRNLEVFEPPQYIWTRISAHLDEADAVPRGWLHRLRFAGGRLAWIRADALALAALLVIGCGAGVMHWAAVRAERQQLAELDRAFSALLPESAESYNPFERIRRVDTNRNPFAEHRLKSPVSGPPAVRR
jgi:anti-sigma factor RsiW